MSSTTMNGKNRFTRVLQFFGGSMPLRISTIVLLSVHLGFADGQTAGTQVEHTANVNSPVWSTIEINDGITDVSYYKYYYIGTTPAKTETTLTTTSPRPPITLHYIPLPSGAPASQLRTVCQIVNQPGYPLYWYNTMTHNSIAGQYPSATPQEFNVSRQEGPQKGIQFEGSFSAQTAGGSPSGAGLDEAVYFTDRTCSDAGSEYGFEFKVVPGTFRFYWSIRTNCPGGGGCQSGSTWNTPPTNELDQRYSWVDISQLSGAQTGTQYYYHAYFIPSGATYKFRIEVLSTSTQNLTTCSFNGAPASYCSYDVQPDSWFPVSTIHSDYGYVVTTANNYGAAFGNPNLAASPAPQLFINQLHVGK